MNPSIVYRFAAGLAFIGVLAHEFVGAPMVLNPLETSGLPDNVIWLHHFSWHVGTVSVIAMMGMYGYASIRPGNHALAIVATGVSAGFAALGALLATFGDTVGWTTPAPYIWTVVTVVGAYGVIRDLAQAELHHAFE